VLEMQFYKDDINLHEYNLGDLIFGMKNKI